MVEVVPLLLLALGKHPAHLSCIIFSSGMIRQYTLKLWWQYHVILSMVIVSNQSSYLITLRVLDMCPAVCRNSSVKDCLLSMASSELSIQQQVQGSKTCRCAGASDIGDLRTMSVCHSDSTHTALLSTASLSLKQSASSTSRSSWEPPSAWHTSP